MPSQALLELSQHIANQKTDSFGKFYLYATLLKKITRDKQKDVQTGRIPTLFDMMPVYTYTGVDSWRIKLGNLDDSFNAAVNKVDAQFDIKVPNPILAIQRIFLTFFRKGQLSDLTFIIDKMNEHLSAEPMAQTTYNARFAFSDSRKAKLKNLVSSAQQVSRLAHEGVDNGIYALGTIIAAILAVKVTMFLGGLLLTLAMFVGAGFAAFHFVQVAMESLKNIKNAIKANEKIMESIAKDQLEACVYKPNHLSFIINGVLAPIAYTMVAIREQTSTDSEMLAEARAERAEVDSKYETYNKGF